jgi:NADH-quinone oxidoreductase subunit I
MLGKGLIRGLAETGRNFVGSYIDAARLPTVQYPEERLPQKESARVFPFLVHDGPDPVKSLRCVACLICEKECPPQCISIVKDASRKPDASGKLQFQPKVFDLDLSVCMSCQICVEVCPFDAIKMDVEYELSTTDRFGGLLLHKEQLARPNSYFRQIHPAEAAEVDARLNAARSKAQTKAKPAASGPTPPPRPPASPPTAAPGAA